MAGVDAAAADQLTLPDKGSDHVCCCSCHLDDSHTLHSSFIGSVLKVQILRHNTFRCQGSCFSHILGCRLQLPNSNPAGLPLVTAATACTCVGDSQVMSNIRRIEKHFAALYRRFWLTWWL